MIEENKEMWKDIKGCEGKYQVSNKGRVKSLSRLVTSYGNRTWVKKEQLLSLSLNRFGYPHVSMHYPQGKKTKVIHKLVAQAFLGHEPNGYNDGFVVNHINHNRTDNRVENLEIVTARENTNKKHLKSVSDHVGVDWNKSVGKWRARIYIDNKPKHLGYFTCELQAAKAYQDVLKNIDKGKDIPYKSRVRTSKYKGVSFYKKSGKWVARIIINGKLKNLGYFKTEEEAHQVYQEKLKQLESTPYA